MKANIQTVTGLIQSGQLGHCQFHEHILLSKGISYQRNSALCMDSYEKSLKELKCYIGQGGRTIVDAQPVGCNRMTEELRDISRESGVQIIASTGFHKMEFYPPGHWIFEYSEEQIRNVFVSELQSGMYIDAEFGEPNKAIPVKAGLIKTALDSQGLTEQYKKLFNAAAYACRRTGRPVMIHTDPGTDPIQLFEYLAQREIPGEKMVFCHLDRTCKDISIHKELCKRGAYLEYDTIGRQKYHSDEAEAEIFLDMLRSGYEDRILFSLDTTAQRLRAYNPNGVGLDYIIKTFIPLLVRYGATEKQIHKISHINCGRVFESG